MRPIVSVLMLVLVANTLFATPADKPKAQYRVTLQLHVNDSCELHEPATLLLYGKYAAVVPDGRNAEWYSPEFGKRDVIAVPATDSKIIKAVKKSGFQVASVPGAPASSAEVTRVGNANAECPTPDAALTAVDAERQQRRTQVQSKLASLTDHDVTPPEPQQRVSAPSAQQAIDAAGPKPKLSHGTVGLLVLVGTDGHVHGIKVVAPLDPVLDTRAANAVQQWDFGPARKHGLPVPVKINVEVNFKRE